MLHYDEFKDYVKEHITEFLPDKYSVSSVEVVPIHKNHETLDGLLIRLEGVNVAPTIYLNDYFHAYREEEISLSIALTRIAAAFSNYAVTESVNVDFVNDFDKVAGRIIPKIVGIEDNEAYLEDKVYSVKADLAVTFAVLLEADAEGSKTIAVTKSMADGWGTSADVLEHVAKDNLNSLMPYSFVGISQMMIEMMGEEQAGEIGIEEMPAENEIMFVLTNEQKEFGAAELINEAAMEKIRDVVQSDFYILPSSVHEVLCVRTDAFSVPELEALVQEVNATQVEAKDRLSDHVYKYDYERHELYRADQEMQRQEELRSNQMRSNNSR